MPDIPIPCVMGSFCVAQAPNLGGFKMNHMMGRVFDYCYVDLLPRGYTFNRSGSIVENKSIHRSCFEQRLPSDVVPDFTKTMYHLRPDQQTPAWRLLVFVQTTLATLGIDMPRKSFSALELRRIAAQIFVQVICLSFFYFSFRGFYLLWTFFKFG